MLFACNGTNAKRWTIPVGRRSSTLLLELTTVPVLADAKAGGCIVFLSHICTTGVWQLSCLQEILLLRK